MANTGRQQQKLRKRQKKMSEKHLKRQTDRERET